MPPCWLMKAEPDSRIDPRTGVDVKFGLDDFRASKDQTTSWEGVRNAEAGKHMRERMKLGDRVLFYASNTKVPGVSALAKIVKEGYPDHSAWDPKHPYYDAKSSADAPRWFMVDVQFVSELPHFVPLALLQDIAALPAKDARRNDIDYLSDAHLEALKTMQLLTRGRLSVQPVEQTAYDAVELLGTRGGWTQWVGKWNAGKGKGKATKSVKAEEDEGESAPAPKRRKAAESEQKPAIVKREPAAPRSKAPGKPAANETATSSGLRRSSRNASK